MNTDTYDFVITMSDESAAYWYNRLFAEDLLSTATYPLPPAPSNRLIISYAFPLAPISPTERVTIFADAYGVVDSIYTSNQYINGKYIVAIRKPEGVA